MATLPDVSSLGPLSSSQGKGSDPNYATPTFARPIEPVEPVRVSKVDYVPADNARGMVAVGEGVQSIANAGLRILGREQQKQDDLDNAINVGNYTSARIALDSEVNNTFDINKLRTDYPQKYDEIRNKIADSISDPYRKELFLAHTTDDLARGKATLEGRINSIGRDTEVGTLISTSENFHKDFVKVEKEEDRQIVFNRMNTMITAAENKGIITHEQGEKFRNSWTTQAVEGWYKNQPADVVVRELGGLKGALMHRESSGNPTLVNQFGFAGLYQFGAPRLKDLGIYVPGSGEHLNNRSDLHNWNSSGKDAPGKWSGQFNIPGFPEVKTLKDFLANPSAQEAAFNIHISKMDAELKSAGLEKYIGTAVNGVPITKEGIYAMAHLGGMGGAKAALEGNDVRDANGSSVLSYAKLGMSQGRFSDILSPERKLELYDNKSKELIAGTQQQQLAIRVAENQKRDVANDATQDYVSRVLNNKTDNILVDLNADPRLDATQKLNLKRIVDQEINDPTQLEARSFGTGYANALQDLAQHKITNYDEIMQLRIEGKLTTQGANALWNDLQRNKKTDLSDGVLSTKAHFIAEAKRYLSYENQAINLKDDVGENLFNTVFMPRFNQEFEEHIKKGGSPYEFLTKERVEKMYTSLRSRDDINRSMLSAVGAGTGERKEPVIMPPPDTVKVEQSKWQTLIQQRPNATNGNPIDAGRWSAALRALAETPTRKNVEYFNKAFPSVRAETLLNALGVTIND